MLNKNDLAHMERAAKRLGKSFIPPKFVGYWYSEHEPELPNVADFIDDAWAKEERDVIANYLKAGKLYIGWMGWSDCRVCGKMNGSTCLTDETYIWPSGFAHYITEHNVKPPQEFIEHILLNIKK